MWATKSALTLGMHHCFFCHGLRMFFSGAAALSRGTGTQPLPVQPSGPPAGADSSGRGPRGPGCRPGRSDEPPARSSTLRYRWAWTRSFKAPSNPSSAKRRLRRNTVPSDTSRAWATLGADQPSSVLSRMRARVVTLAELLPAQTMCSSWLRSSGVSRTANFSLTTPPRHNNTNCPKISTTSQPTSTLSKPRLTRY